METFSRDQKGIETCFSTLAQTMKLESNGKSTALNTWVPSPASPVLTPNLSIRPYCSIWGMLAEPGSQSDCVCCGSLFFLILDMWGKYNLLGEA